MKNVEYRNAWAFLDDYRGKEFEGEWPRVNELFHISVLRFGSNDVFRAFEPDESYTYEEAERIIMNVAGWLQENGFRPGDRIGVAGKNSPQWVMAYFAVLYMGGIIYPLDNNLRNEEMLHFIEFGDIKAVFTDKERAETLDADGKAGISKFSLEPGSACTWIMEMKGAYRDPGLKDAEDVASIIFTSGTTGPSKPAVLSRRALAANALAVGRHIEMTSEDIWLLSLSAARVGGLGILTRSLCIRSAVCIGPKYTAKNFVEQLERDRITIASLVPTMLTDVLEHYPDWTPPESFRLLLVGGAACPVNLRRKALAAHIPIVTTYAMTETASSVAMSPYEERLTENFLADRALEGAEIRLENNQIEVRGEMLMSGYWGRSKLEKGQWLRSGDIADMDAHGGFRIRARQSEVLITGGEKVYPAEVELALEEIEGIRSALVAGIPDEKWGVIVAALLVADSDRDPLEDKAIVEGLLPRLARYKCPRRIAWVKELPKTREGKYSRTPAAFDGLKLQTLHYVNAARQ